LTRAAQAAIGIACAPSTRKTKGKKESSETETMSQLLKVMEELRAILKDEKQLARITDPELIQLRSLLDEQRSVLWRIEQQKAKKDEDR
jgi:hypothetical protein